MTTLREQIRRLLIRFPGWMRIFRAPSGTPHTDNGPPMASTLRSVDPFHLSLERLIGNASLDWQTIGMDVGRLGNDLEALRRLVDDYFEYRSASAELMLANAKEALGSEPFQLQLEELATEIRDHQSRIKTLTDRCQKVRSDPAEGRFGSRTAELQAILQDHVTRRKGWNDLLHEDQKARMELVAESAGRIRTARATFDVQITKLTETYIQSTDAETRDDLSARLEQLRQQFEAVVEAEARFEMKIRSSIASISAMHAANPVLADQKERLKSDEEFVRQMRSHSRIPILARSRFGIWLLGFAIICAASAEFSVVNKVTGTVLEIGSISQLIREVQTPLSSASDIVLDADVAGGEGAGFSVQWGPLVDLLSSILLALVPFALGFWIKSLLDGDVVREGRNHAIVNKVMVGSVILYMCTMLIRIWRLNDLTLALVFLPLTAMLTLLNGWLLHLFFRSREAYREHSHEANEVVGTLKGQIADYTESLRRLQRSRNELLQRARSEKEHWQKEVEVLEALARRNTDSQTTERECGKSVALAAAELGYGKGLLLRASGEPSRTSVPSEEQILSTGRLVRLLRSVFPSLPPRST